MKIRLFSIVFLSGAVVLAVEILGTRILAPFYGLSIFLWSALITVTLAALSIGYVVGGRLADKHGSFAFMGSIMSLAALWLLALPWLEGPLLNLSSSMGLRSAVLTAATVLFGPPLILLGMINPIGIRLYVSDVKEVGRGAGELAAVSTLASVAAAIATGFWLIPQLGVRRLTLYLAAALFAGALLCFTEKFRGRSKVISLLLLLVLPATILTAFRANTPVSDLISFSQESAYGKIEVMDSEGFRYLLIDEAVHSVCRLGDTRSNLPYVPVFDLAHYYFEQPGNALLVGLGAGHVAMDYDEAGWKVDAIEIDPVVAEFARKHFALSEKNINVSIEDGRLFVANSNKKYQAILLDAFGSASIPFHLVSAEALSLCEERLSDDGVLMMNVECIGWNDILVSSLAKTLSTVFDHVSVLPTSEPPNSLGNVVLIATNRTNPEFEEGLLLHPKHFIHDDYLHWFNLQQNHAWDNRFTPNESEGILLTDDRNPADIWAERINLAARKDLREFFALREARSE